MTSSGSGTGTPATSGYHILTNSEAAVALRCEVTDTNMLQLLPMVDKYIEHATGRDWTLDSPIYSEAKAAARLLIVRWHEDPGGMAAGDTLGPGMRAALTQLEYLRMYLDSTAVMADEGLEIVSTNIQGEMAITASFVVVFNHKMATGTTAAVLKDVNGSTVATTNSWDVGYRQLTVNPDASLTAASSYSLVLTDITDVYGSTLTETLYITTA